MFTYLILAALITQAGLVVGTRSGVVDAGLDPTKSFVGFLYLLFICPIVGGLFAPFIVLFVLWGALLKCLD